MHTSITVVQPGVYRHWKGKFYYVIGTVIDDETKEPMILYIPLYVTSEYATQMVVRSADNFRARVKDENQNEVLRFTRVQ